MASGRGPRMAGAAEGEDSFMRMDGGKGIGANERADGKV